MNAGKQVLSVNALAPHSQESALPAPSHLQAGLSRAGSGDPPGNLSSLCEHTGPVLAWYTEGGQKPEFLSPASLPLNRPLTGKTSLPLPKDKVAPEATSNYTCLPS